jgi:chorismate dehydratase
LTNYSLYQTLDESYTFTNNDYQENYHSNAGAWQEAQLKYFNACRIAEKLNDSKPIQILELGFGLGYNLIPLFNYIEANPTFKLEYISFEKDINVFTELIDQIDRLYPKHTMHFFKKLLKQRYYIKNNFEIKIITKDIRNEIKSIGNNCIDAIFHDPFSPYKNSECWTLELFKEYYRIIKNDGILSTYSISTPVRSGLFQAGFNVWKGVGDQTKSGGTIASKLNHSFEILTEHEQNKLINSPERIPFTDSSFCSTLSEIKTRRNDQKKNNDYSLIKRII